MKNKKLLVTITVIFSVLVFLGTFLVIWFWGDTYSDFADFNEGVAIPGLDEGAVPQGLANYDGGKIYDCEGVATEGTQNYFFISSYMKEGPSRVYVVGAKTGYVGYVTLINTDGSDYMGHCGGIATSCKPSERNGTVWVSSDDTVYCIRRVGDTYQNAAEEIIAKAALAEGDKTVKFTTSFAANCNASFCFFYEDTTSGTTYDKLYVGEFYRAGNYETDPLHHVTTNNGTENRSFMYEYSISSTNDYGLTLLAESTGVAEADRVPAIQAIFSIPDKIQGFARIRDTESTNSDSNGTIVLSESYGLANSNLYYYDFAKVRASSNRKYYHALTGVNFAYEGVFREAHGSEPATQYTNPNLYVYFVDDSSLIRQYSLPSMSEGLCVSGERVYVLFESASYFYKHFVRQQLKNVYWFIPRQ